MIARKDEAARVAAIIDQATACHFGGAKGEAERLYKQVLAIDPSHPIAGYNLALLLIDSGRLGAARAKLLSLVKARPADAPAHHTLGKVFLAEGTLTKSLFHFRRALELEPARLDTYLELIDTYRELGRLDDARQVADIAAARFPQHAEVPTKLGIAFLTAGQREEARRLFQAAVALNPGFVVALYNLAKLTDEEGDRATALEIYRKAR